MNAQRRHELTDDQWERLAPLLPPEKPSTGRPTKDHRTVVNGIVWLLRTGAPWRDLPERYGAWKTVDSRVRRWPQTGVWERILAELQTEAAHDNRLDDSLGMIDSSSMRAHQHAAGAPKRESRSTSASDAAGADSAVSCIWSPGGRGSRWPRG